jgi:hypothetical protein
METCRRRWSPARFIDETTRRLSSRSSECLPFVGSVELISMQSELVSMQSELISMPSELVSMQSEPPLELQLGVPAVVGRRRREGGRREGPARAVRAVPPVRVDVMQR